MRCQVLTTETKGYTGIHGAFRVHSNKQNQAWRHDIYAIKHNSKMFTNNYHSTNLQVKLYDVEGRALIGSSMLVSLI